MITSKKKTKNKKQKTKNKKQKTKQEKIESGGQPPDTRDCGSRYWTGSQDQQQKKRINKEARDCGRTTVQMLGWITRSLKKMNIATRDCGGQLCRYWVRSQDQQKQTKM